MGVLAMGKAPAEYAKEPAEKTWERIQKDPRPFDPKLGDQAVKLLDKAITTFRERRAAVMNKLEEDEQTLEWSKKEIAWIEKKIAGLKQHKADCTVRLEQVKEALEKFGA